MDTATAAAPGDDGRGWDLGDAPGQDEEELDAAGALAAGAEDDVEVEDDDPVDPEVLDVDESEVLDDDVDDVADDDFDALDEPAPDDFLELLSVR